MEDSDSEDEVPVRATRSAPTASRSKGAIKASSSKADAELAAGMSSLAVTPKSKTTTTVAASPPKGKGKVAATPAPAAPAPMPAAPFDEGYDESTSHSELVKETGDLYIWDTESEKFQMVEGDVFVFLEDNKAFPFDCKCAYDQLKNGTDPKFSPDWIVASDGENNMLAHKLSVEHMANWSLVSRVSGMISFFTIIKRLSFF